MPFDGRTACLPRKIRKTSKNPSFYVAAMEPHPSAFAPVLSGAFGAVADDGLGGALGHAAADRETSVAERHVAHPLLVIADVAQVFPELLAGLDVASGVEGPVVREENLLDVVDG